MLKNIFGKKSTGVVYIVCAALLLLFFAGALLAHFRAGAFAPAELLAYALFTLFELALISVPVFVQKKYKLYIPPAVEICICIYSLLYAVGSGLYRTRSDVTVNLTPVFGGFVMAMTAFCILYSAAAARAEKKRSGYASPPSAFSPSSRSACARRSLSGLPGCSPFRSRRARRHRPPPSPPLPRMRAGRCSFASSAGSPCIRAAAKGSASAVLKTVKPPSQTGAPLSAPLPPT